MLSWTQNGHDVEAFGHRGHYLIKRAPGLVGCVLTATGHDGLPVLALPAYGRTFDTPQKAKDFAQRLEMVKAVEPSAGGE